MRPAKDSAQIWQEVRQLHDLLLTCEWGVPYLDDALNGLFPRETTLFGARSGSGKTELALQVLLTQEAKAKSVLYFALDHEHGEMENRILWRNLTAKIKKEKPQELSGRTLRYSDWRAGKYIGLLTKYEDDRSLRWEYIKNCSETRFVYKKNELTAHDIAKIITSAGYEKEFNLCVVDHFHALRFPGKDRFESQRESMKVLCEAAEKSERPMLVMAQFRKGLQGKNKAPIPDFDEFSGPADIVYIPQNIVVMAPRHVDGEFDSNETYFHVVKARTASDAKPFVGVHSFDTETRKYSPKYRIGRFMPNSDPKIIERPADVPEWSKKNCNLPQLRFEERKVYGRQD